MKTNKLLSSFLAVAIVLTSLLVPMAATAADETTAGDETAAVAASIEAADGFVRIIPTDTSFKAGNARSFTFTVPEDGDYAVFFKHTAAKNDYTVSFKSGDSEAVAYNTKGTGGYAGYNYNYIRLRAARDCSDSVSLAKGTCTITIDSLLDTTIEYIDIRSTEVPVNGGKIGIYPSDYNVYSNVMSSGHINQFINYGENKLSGYTYYDDYNSSALTAKRTNVPYIHMCSGVSATYQLNVTKAGTYTVAIDQMFYSYGASSESNDDTDNKTGTANIYLNEDTNPVCTQNGEVVVYKNGGRTDNGERVKLVANLELAEGENTITYEIKDISAYFYSITLDEVVDYGDNVVNVDNNLTRIELAENLQSISANTARSMKFTVPVDGEYIFAAPHKSSYEGNINVVVKNMDTTDITTVYDGSWQDKQNNAVEKLGNKDTAAVALKANTIYELTLTPSADLTVTYIDVYNTVIPVDGKTGIPSYYVTATDAAVDGLSCDDCREAIPEDYSIVGDFTSNKLAAPSTVVPMHVYVAGGKYFDYTLNVKTAGYYQFTIPTGHWENKDLSGKMHFSVDGTEFGTAAYSGTSTVKTGTLVSPAVYLYEGVQTLTLQASGCGMYAYYILADTAEESTCAANAEVLPTGLLPNFIINTSGDISSDGVALNDGEYATWSFKIGSAVTNLRFTEGTIPENAAVRYKFDEEQETEATLTDLGKVFAEKTFTEEGEHTLTVTSQTNGLVIKKLTLTDDVTTIVASSGEIRTKAPLSCGAIVRGGGSLDTESGSLKTDSAYTIDFDIADEGYYTIYLTSTIKQNGFRAYFDGKDVTEPWWKDTGSQSTERENTSMDKRLVRPVKLTAGRHTFVLETVNNCTATLGGKIELRRVDGPLYEGVSDGVRIIPAWDFIDTTVTVNGWFFSQQYPQGGVLSKAPGYEDFSLRNVVLSGDTKDQGWTYAVTVTKDGYYNFGIYKGSSGPAIRVTFDGGDTASYTVTSSNSVEKSALGTVFLTAGEHRVNVKNGTSGTLRMNALYFEKCDTIAVDTESRKASVCLGLDEAISGTVIAAFYKGSELVGVKTVEAAETKDISVSGVALSDIPDSAKVMVWENLNNVKPLTAAQAFTTESTAWAEK